MDLKMWIKRNVKEVEKALKCELKMCEVDLKICRATGKDIEKIEKVCDTSDMR